MSGRIMIALLAMMFGLGLMGTSGLAGGHGDEAVLREDDAAELMVAYDDDDGQGGTGNSGDGTFNSGTADSTMATVPTPTRAWGTPTPSRWAVPRPEQASPRPQLGPRARASPPVQ